MSRLQGAIDPSPSKVADLIGRDAEAFGNRVERRALGLVDLVSFDASDRLRRDGREIAPLELSLFVKTAQGSSKSSFILPAPAIHLISVRAIGFVMVRVGRRFVFAYAIPCSCKRPSHAETPDALFPAS
jgi:hypothetical protein